MELMCCSRYLSSLSKACLKYHCRFIRLDYPNTYDTQKLPCRYYQFPNPSIPAADSPLSFYPLTPAQTSREVAVPSAGIGTPVAFSKYSLLALMYLFEKNFSELRLSHIVNLLSSSRRRLMDCWSMFVWAMSSGRTAVKNC